MKMIITTEKAPKGPYSQAIRADGWLFLSGQLPLNSANGEVICGGVGPQVRQVLDNIKAILATEGLPLANVVKTTVFLHNMDDFSEMNRIYAEYFTAEPPARSAVQVARLPRDVSVEIEAITYC